MYSHNFGAVEVLVEELRLRSPLEHKQKQKQKRDSIQTQMRIRSDEGQVSRLIYYRIWKNNNEFIREGQRILPNFNLFKA